MSGFRRGVRLGIDVGKARVGVSRCDPDGMLAVPVETVPRSDSSIERISELVREWEPLWRSMLPVDEIFETVVDSGFVGCRKPESKIYALTLERIGADAGSCLFVDDVHVNCEGAQRAGMTAVHFRENAQAIAEIRALL